MIIFSRILIGVIGLFALLGVIQHWFSLDAVAAERGMQAIGAIGRANLRADVGGLFLGIGCLSLFAAARQDRSAVLATAVLLGATLLGRIVSLAIDGYSPRVGPPIFIEAVVLILLCATYRVWSKKPEGL